MILMGIFATYFMDFLAGFLAKRKLIHAFITSEAVGRWFLYMFRGKFIHNDILKTPALNHEKLWCLISHYLIGIVLAGIYLLLELKAPTISDIVWSPLIFGIATVGTMMLAVYIGYKGTSMLKFKKHEKYLHLLAGMIILVSASGILFFGW